MRRSRFCQPFLPSAFNGAPRSGWAVGSDLVMVRPHNVERETPCPTPSCPSSTCAAFAMTRGEIDETTADPFCGFNLAPPCTARCPTRRAGCASMCSSRPSCGWRPSTAMRTFTKTATTSSMPTGTASEMPPADHHLPLLRRGLRYPRHGRETPSIEEFARGACRGWSKRVRELYLCQPAQRDRRPTSAVIWVAHSMGGLVSRVFLQNPPRPRRCSSLRGQALHLRHAAQRHRRAGHECAELAGLADINNF